METLISPLNNVLVTIDSKFTQNVTNAIRMANLNPNVQINPADYCQIIGDIVSVPRGTSKRIDYSGYSLDGIRVGDVGIFSYTVVYSFIELGNNEATYKNCFWYKGKDYWKVDIQSLYGVIRGKEIIMMNGYCMIENLEPESPIVLLEKDKKNNRAQSATLTHIGKNLTGMKQIEAQVGDTVFFNPSKAVKYNIGDKHFAIIRQRDILGHEIGAYSFLVS